MNKRRLHGFCVGLLLFAVAVRALSAVGVGALRLDRLGQDLEAPATRLWTLHMLAAVQTPAEPAAEVPEQPVEESVEAPAVQPSLEFSAGEAEAITIGGACSYPVDKQALLLQPSTLDFSQDGPKVLIVHTHSSEAYTQETGWEYAESDELRTEDTAYSVIRVGDEIADVLEGYGIETLHDTALNDYPTYDGAYYRMELTINNYLAQYPSIQMVIDVHRDATSDADGNPTGFVTQINGESCAQIMLVMGTDEGGLEHPNWRENLANALKLQALLNRSYPGLCKNMDLRTERFNEHETPGSMLAEFGSTGNTLQEAIRAGRYFAEGVAEMILGLS